MAKFFEIRNHKVQSELFRFVRAYQNQVIKELGAAEANGHTELANFLKIEANNIMDLWDLVAEQSVEPSK